MTNTFESFDLPLSLRLRRKEEWQTWLLDRIREGDMYITLALNGSTRVQRKARERALYARRFDDISPGLNGGLGSANTSRSRIDLGFAKRQITATDGHRLLYALCNGIDRFNLGPRYHLKPLPQRCSMVAFCENPETNLHFEAILRMPCIRRGYVLADALSFAQDKWRKLAPAGTMNVEKHIRDEAAVSVYITKQLARIGAWDGFFARGDFSEPPSDESCSGKATY